MTRGWWNICPVCGNYMVNGVCLRCRANAATRAKRWRTGDKGGVRSERRNYHRKKFDTDKPAKTASTKSPAKRINVRKKKAYKGFLRSLQGEWYSFNRKIKINIDLAHNRWIFTLPSGKRVSQVWEPKEYTAKRLLFVRDGDEIKVTIAEGGVLVMTGKKGPVTFVCLLSGKKHRLCKWCYRKSEWWRRRCKHCRSKL